MSCENCEKNQDSGMVAYYRWKKANIGMTGCDEHLMEIFKALHNYNHEIEPFLTLGMESDGADHKQYCLGKIAEIMGVNMDGVDKGVAP